MSRCSRLCRALVAALICVILASAALAQKGDEEKLPPFDVPGLKHTKQWVPWVVAFLFAAGCVAVAFKNPHRSHLD